MKTARKKPAAKLSRSQIAARREQWEKERDKQFQLWRIMARDQRHGGAIAVGYLATDRQRIPGPIVIITEVGERALRAITSLARHRHLIDRDLGQTWGAIDCRGSTATIFPVALLGMLLYPIDHKGQWTKDQAFPAAMYVRPIETPVSVAFVAHTGFGLDTILRGDAKAAPIPMSGSPIAFSRGTFGNRLRESAEASASAS